MSPFFRLGLQMPVSESGYQAIIKEGKAAPLSVQECPCRLLSANMCSGISLDYFCLLSLYFGNLRTKKDTKKSFFRFFDAFLFHRDIPKIRLPAWRRNKMLLVHVPLNA